MNTSRPFRLWFCPTTSNGPFYFSESPLLIFNPINVTNFQAVTFNSEWKQPIPFPWNHQRAVSGFEAIHPSLWPFDKIPAIGALGDRLCCFFFRFNNHSGAASEDSFLQKLPPLRLCTKRGTSTVQLDKARRQNNVLCFPEGLSQLCAV